MLQVNGSSEWFSSNATAGRVPLASRYTLEERRASFNAGRARGGVAPMPPDAPWEQRYTPLPADAEGAAAEEGSGAADQDGGRGGGPRWWLSVTTLVAIQLGWGLWLLPFDFARLGWAGAILTICALAGLTVYSGHMFGRLRKTVPHAVLFGDIGEEAFGKRGRRLCYAVVYFLDATRCVILHLAAAQSLQRAAGGTLGLWTAGGIVAVIEIAVSQVQSLARLSWLLTAGTAAQQLTIVLVLTRLLMNPDPAARHELFQTRDMDAALVAVMNLVFAFGGQFSWVEVMGTMRQPQRFPAAVAACTGIMTAAYLSVGAVGYWSKGDRVKEIVLFSLDQDAWARAAACLLLIQATGQYLANINIWAGNICALLRRKTPWCGSQVAYTLPAAFCIKLLSDQQPRWETNFQALQGTKALVPASLALSALGLYASTHKLLQDVERAAPHTNGGAARAAMHAASECLLGRAAGLRSSA